MRFGRALTRPEFYEQNNRHEQIHQRAINEERAGNPEYIFQDLRPDMASHVEQHDDERQIDQGAEAGRAAHPFQN